MPKCLLSIILLHIHLCMYVSTHPSFKPSLPLRLNHFLHFFLSPVAGLLTLGTTDILTCVNLCLRGCPAYLKMFSSIPGLHSLDANIILILVMTTKNVFKYWEMDGQFAPCWEILPYEHVQKYGCFLSVCRQLEGVYSG